MKTKETSRQTDVLLWLAKCSSGRLFLIVAGARLFLLLAMYFFHAILPSITGADFFFDTGLLLYEDVKDNWRSLDFPRNWDGVHFFHIARNGYSHENTCVFFPLIPLIVRIISWVVDCISFVEINVPLSFLLSFVNVVAAGVAGVVLQRLTALTLLGSQSIGGGGGRDETNPSGFWASHRKRGTWLDELPPLPSAIPLPLSSSSSSSGEKDGRKRDMDTQKHLQREIGAAVFIWMINPAAIFTVVAYTESIYSLLSLLGVYLLALPPPLEKKKRGAAMLAEIGAVLCFFLAGWARSNATISLGFILYPTFLQIFFFETYKRRYARRYGTMTPPPRWPSVWRCLAIIVEVFIICVPYLSLNYFCWRRFVPLWDAASRSMIGNRFWSFYGWMQKRYWNVGFLSSFTIRNFPNVILASPSAFFVTRCFWIFYWRPVCGKIGDPKAQSEDEKGKGTREIKQYSSRERGIFKFLEALVQSSNVLYLMVMLLVGLTVIHVNVVSRFIMSCPAFYWLLGRQIAWDPRGKCSIVMIRVFIIWVSIGLLFFPNGMPWT